MGERVRVGIVGGSGYAGGELARLLSLHPGAQLTYIASRKLAGQPIEAGAPGLRGRFKLVYEPLDLPAMAERCDIIFLAVPHGVAIELALPLLGAGRRVIDIGADFRLKDPAAYESWYHAPHGRADLLQEAVYGLPELHRETVRTARLVGNPGCYPTGTILALWPLVRAGWVARDAVAVAGLSGVSGAGSTPQPMYHFPECTENVQPYSIGGHRHVPEMEQELSQGAGRPVSICFTPHLVPMSRGILITAVVPTAAPVTAAALQELYETAYAAEPFVRVLPAGELPRTRAVWGSNFCDVAVRFDERAGKIVALSAIDNLVKGASGQAIQNMNLMYGLPETAGLEQPGFSP